MARGNVTFSVQNGGLNRRAANTDAYFGLVISAPAIVGKMQNGITYVLNSLADAAALGITAAYDTANTVLVYHHIYRFFTRNPNATLALLTAPQTATLANMTDLTQAYAAKLLKDQNGSVKYIGVARNPAAGYEPVLQTGLDTDVFQAIANAQALAASEFAAFRYAPFLIEGRSFNGTAGAAKDLRSLEAQYVSCTIAADPAISGSNPAFAGYAAIGDVLGLISLAAVSQDVGELSSTFNLNNDGLGFFQTAGLSSNLAVSTYADADLDALDTKGYIFPDVIAGFDGFYLNDSHTCSVLADNDYAYIENVRTMFKAVFLARQALLPRVKSRLYIDPATGKLLPQDCKTLETTGKGALQPMADAGDISGSADFYCDPNQNVSATSQVNIEATFTPVSIGRQIVVGIGFSNPFKSNS